MILQDIYLYFKRMLSEANRNEVELGEAKSRKAGNFKEYRQKNRYSEKSIRMQDSHVNGFNSWCINENINPGDVTYRQVLQYR